jgi:hypothetical protein
LEFQARCVFRYNELLSAEMTSGDLRDCAARLQGDSPKIAAGQICRGSHRGSGHLPRVIGRSCGIRRRRVPHRRFVRPKSPHMGDIRRSRGISQGRVRLRSPQSARQDFFKDDVGRPRGIELCGPSPQIAYYHLSRATSGDLAPFVQKGSVHQPPRVTLGDLAHRSVTVAAAIISAICQLSTEH